LVNDFIKKATHVVAFFVLVKSRKNILFYYLGSKTSFGVFKHRDSVSTGTPSIWLPIIYPRCVRVSQPLIENKNNVIV
jgi:hypothetical protein